MKSLTEFQQKVAAMKKDEENIVVIEVWKIFLQQSTTVGSPTRCSFRPINLNNSRDRKTFISSVKADIEKLKQGKDFATYPMIDETLQKAQEYLFS
ncbi:MAG: hypothetical protein KAT32_03820 [Candidatus Moranbacteria bacterium]|nr:hypothetical protein [Candidatus Moranbacteria bacterium]